MKKIDEKTRNLMIQFARHCMLELLSEEDSLVGKTISGENLTRIEKILNKFSPTKEQKELEQEWLKLEMFKTKLDLCKEIINDNNSVTVEWLMINVLGLKKGEDF